MSGYWLNYEYYELPSGCGPAQSALTSALGLASREQCLARCSMRPDCAGALYHKAEGQCTLYAACEGQPGQCADALHGSCAYIRGSVLKKLEKAKGRRASRRRKIEIRDRPQRVPHVPMGENANVSAMRALCPNGEFISCLSADLAKRYPIHALFEPRKLPWREPLSNARTVFRRLQPNCSAPPPRTPAAVAADAETQSFVEAALEPARDLHAAAGVGGPPPLPEPRRAALRAVAAAAAAAAQRSPRLECASAAGRLNAGLQLLLGVPSGPSEASAERRAAARDSWMRDAQVGRSVGVCFLLSAYSYEPARAREHGWAAEAARERDLLFLQVAETPQLLAKPTRYSNHTKQGRGMPTFKQFAFFRHAAALLPGVAYVGKIDDDTAVNLRLLGPLLAEARCVRWGLFGSIQWSGFIPHHEATGVRGDRCGFGWDWLGAMRDYGQPGPALSRVLPRAGCVAFGAVPPFPYAAGAGYLFSAPLLRWVGLSARVGGWVLRALGASRDEVQWQKFEDTSTGYWLTHAPQRVEYVNIGFWHHDLQCMPRGEEFAMKGGIYRPPANFSILVHNLKRGGFNFTYARMQRHLPYDDNACRRDTFAGRRARRRRADGGAATRRPHATRQERKRKRGMGIEAGSPARLRRRNTAGPVAADSRL